MWCICVLYVYVCMYLYVFVCICMYLYVFVCICMYCYVLVCICMCLYVFVCIGMYLYVFVCICMYLYVFVYIYIYIHEGRRRAVARRWCERSQPNFELHTIITRNASPPPSPPPRWCEGSQPNCELQTTIPRNAPCPLHPPLLATTLSAPWLRRETCGPRVLALLYSLFRLPPPETMPLLSLLRPSPPISKRCIKTQRPRETLTSPIAPMRCLTQPRYWSNAVFKTGHWAMCLRLSGTTKLIKASCRSLSCWRFSDWM